MDSRRANIIGFTLLELMLASVVLAIAITGLMAVITECVRMTRSTEERGQALSAIRLKIDEMRGQVFADIFDNYVTHTFTIEGLTPSPLDPDGIVGEVEFPTAGPELREDIVDSNLGMPRDLNGDGAIDNGDHASDYLMLPVCVRVTWRGVYDDREVIEFRTILTERD